MDGDLKHLAGHRREWCSTAALRLCERSSKADEAGTRMVQYLHKLDALEPAAGRQNHAVPRIRARFRFDCKIPFGVGIKCREQRPRPLLPVARLWQLASHRPHTHQSAHSVRKSASSIQPDAQLVVGLRAAWAQGAVSTIVNLLRARLDGESGVDWSEQGLHEKYE